MSIPFGAEYQKENVEMRAAYVDAQRELIAKGLPIMLLTADLGFACGLLDVLKEDPKHALNMGIAEQNMASFAAGLSLTGKIPFVHTFACFCSRRAHDQLYISGSYAKLNLKIVGTDPGVSAALNGGTHSCMDDISTFRAFPEITIVEPTDSTMLRKLIPQIANEYGVHYIRLYRKNAIRIYDEDAEFKIGKSMKLREGKDITLIASGMCVYEALQAAEILSKEGIGARVLDMFTIKPLDKDAVLEAASKTGAIVTAENHTVIGGLGSAVSELVSQYHPAIVGKVGIQDLFGEVGDERFLMERFGLKAESIVKKAQEVLQIKKEIH
ncbi:transketolase C-terminal domain-containing protein [Petroclostridium sp. X23]|uniref:transketolase family protein n=1 Tax=Petroclostridium sp. X23 TaxID=3045146 RepID=UPI0024ADDE83|nr:transketolase C-terminal domain-containing protein [Petroclostridium sp. X23]WHH60826.1 transketolase C-terminal domain-containing protein [Petroclostridium sp. X23]